MKIGFDISQIVYQGTGVATYTRSLVEGFSRVAANNHYVLFGASLRKKDLLKALTAELDKKIFHCRFTSLPPKLLEILWNGVHIWPIEKFTGQLDVFHSSDWLEPPAKSAKKVTTIHDFAVFKYPETFKSRGGHNIVANQKRKLFFAKHDCDLIIAVSETTKRDAVDILKIPEKKIRVIYEAPDPIYYPRSGEKITKAKEKFGVKGPYLLCVGTREPRKNLDRAIMAFAQLLPEYPELSLLIAGKYGWGEDSSKFKTQTADLKNKVKMLGFVESEDLAGLYSGAEALVYPSLYEGFGLPILDAMNCGAPVITSDLGSMKELAGGYGILVNPQSIESIAEGMAKVLKSKEAKEEFRLRGLKRSQQFSWDKTTLQTLDAYRSLLE